MKRTKLCSSNELAPGAMKRVRANGKDIALIRAGESYFAIDNACLHRGGSLADGALDGRTVSCPLHGWQFDIATGRCTTKPGAHLTTYSVHVEGDDVVAELPEETPSGKQFLVRFGAMAHVGKFQGAADAPAFERGDRVVIETQRGLEIGDVLLAAEDANELLRAQPVSGQLLRRMTEEDDRIAEQYRSKQPEQLDACEEFLRSRGIAIDLVDAEQLLDGRTLVVYFLGEPLPVMAQIAGELSDRFGCAVQFRPFGESLGSGCGSGCGQGCGSCAHEHAGGCEH